MSVVTVNGSIKGMELGRTYIHEHLGIDLSGQKNDPDARFDCIEAVVEEMKALKDKGISTVVDVTNRGMGRDIKVMERVAEAAGMKVIASTGFYKEPYLPPYVYTMEVKDIVRLLLEDILEGIEGSGIKAHVIGEIGTGKDGITPMEQKVFEVAAKAHLETGKPISTHTTLGALALEQLKLFKGYGIYPGKLLIGHVDLNCDIDYQLRIADSGCFMAFDTIGKVNYQPDEKRIESIVELIKRGHLDQILLSQDITRRSHLKLNGGIGYSYMLDCFIPKLIEAGVAEKHIEHMLCDNPARFLDVQEG
ncbi:MAG TPA: phosphotriesterase-related protein [Clostridia bacterium]|nr:phosphotriesterase-related protein [Clostridia bacterium]